MSGSEDLIGRQTERAIVAQALDAAQAGTGRLLLLTGEAGVGKTRLLEACLANCGMLMLQGHASEIATPPYGPIVAALRAYLRQRPMALDARDPLTAFLAILLPELGERPPYSDPATLVEALCHTFVAIARAEPTVLTLDDLQWADNATLEILPALAGAIAHEQMLIVGVYRSDEISRGHPARRLRHELRRARLLHELSVAPLDQAETAALAGRLLGQEPHATLAATLYDRTEGVPLFVEELCGALADRGQRKQGAAEHGLGAGSALPIPDTLRDTLLLRLDGLPEPALQLLEIAAVIGREFDLAQAIALSGGAPDSDELRARGLLIERAAGRCAFRHALTRDAVYAEISWLRRRALHRLVAARLEADGAPPQTIAEHWLAAREPEAARDALLRAIDQSCAIHAYHDAAQAARRALDLWPDGVEEGRRLALLDRMGHCAQLSGLLPEAAHAWRELADAAGQLGDRRATAEAARKLAAVAELQGAWERALAARAEAAQAFLACGLAAEAAAERLTAAAHLRSAGRFRAALDLLAAALSEIEGSERWDLRARCLGLEGNIRARMGQVAAGLDLVRQGLSLALDHNQAGAAAEIYQRLADALEHAGEYQGAKDTYRAAFDYCQASALPATAQLCIACLTVVLQQTGEWAQATQLCREVLALPGSSPHARAVAGTMLGLLHAMRGQQRPALPLLREAALLGRQIELAAVELLSSWGLAHVAALNGDQALAAEHCRAILARWAQVEDCHYVVPALRWAASFFATAQADADLRACADALARIASATGQAEALSALAHALGESALRDGDPGQAMRQFTHALELLREIELPYCRAITEWRAGVACAAADRRETALQHLTNTYRTARRLGARPLATQAALEIEALGEPLGDRLGPGAAHRLGSGDLTRRQREILQLVAQGQTNAEIARQLILSPRTVEMHVANILAALDSRSRAEAARRAADMGLLEEYRSPAKKIP